MATGKVKAGDVFNNWTVLNEDRRNRGNKISSIQRFVNH